MKQFLLVFYKALEEVRLSLKTSRSLITVKQRAGNRYLNVFAVTFALSIYSNYMVFTKEKQIEEKYIEYRRSIESQIAPKTIDAL